jgi:hypothetical protein
VAENAHCTLGLVACETLIVYDGETDNGKEADWNSRRFQGCFSLCRILPLQNGSLKLRARQTRDGTAEHPTTNERLAPAAAERAFKALLRRVKFS